jgi:BASS family bile acid:Na+ symporter
MPLGSLGRLVMVSVLLPLAVGMLLRMVAPAVARALAKPAAVIAMVGLVIGSAAILMTALPAALALVGNGTILAIVAFVALGLAVGHALGGPGLDERAVLALSTACRHPVIAIAIAGANYPEETRVPAAVVLYLLVNVALCIPYIAWLRRMSPTGGSEARLAT